MKRITFRAVLSFVSVATVSSSGKVTAKGYRTATITAAADRSGKTAKCKVTVGYKITYKLNGGKNDSNNPSLYYNQKITLKKLTKNKTYYVKVRAYKTDSAGNKVYGKYSAVSKVRISK